MTNGQNSSLPPQKEADPQELLEVHILLRSQEAITSLFLQDLSGVSPFSTVFSPDPVAKEMTR